MSGLHAVRVAAKLERDLKIDVKRVRGRYGEFKVLVDEDVIVDGGPKVMLGIMPSRRSIVDAVRARLAEGRGTGNR